MIVLTSFLNSYLLIKMSISRGISVSLSVTQTCIKTVTASDKHTHILKKTYFVQTLKKKTIVIA